MSYFNEIIDEHDQYEVAKAQASIAVLTVHAIQELIDGFLRKIKP